MDSSLRALVVDDDVAVRFTVRSILERCGFKVDEAGDGEEGLAMVTRGAKDGGYQLVVTDIHMPRMDGLELLKAIQQFPAPRPKVIVVTAHGTERQTVDAIKSGAFDYFKKPFEVEEVMAVVRRAAESVALSAEVERLSGELSLSRSLIFTSPAMSRLAVLVHRIAPRDVNVLLTGESGTGKERVSEALVMASQRANKSYVRFNCAALTAELAEAELFGHAKGAFTGAVKARAGLFREAHGGTILLDEIGELPLSLQAKLLRVLQEGEVRPVGEDQPVKIDVRIIAATHRDLLQMAAEGKFREDLYYRLKVVHLQIPPLRERPEDVPMLARHYLAEYSRRFGVGPFALTPPLLDRIMAYHWPGNVRELQNAMESIVALSSDNELDLELLPKAKGASSSSPASATPSALTQAAPVLVEPPTSAATGEPIVADLKARMDAYERGIIMNTLDQVRGNRSQAARVLGVNRATLHGKLRKYGITDADDEATDD
ncbi:Response regulator of zinc sigma-54-dependent two-component system [Labilithrix luteola]|uniref:Response regulator of zinc sigma-54-dependent two-component system n=1 Tax=Labilithrix luteola TaxID=1391654 RepID=A0A0K1PTV5_9BACT|nr:sigma-54 dependent transcriptional regulator [Labilithrix luteola]AKU96965.1 Response regulator of zinc sigma-54-dependent two-component system [Labilithrix luteola]